MIESEREALEGACVESAEKIASSHVFMSIFSQSFKKDPVCCLQLGLALLMDKPIGLLVMTGVEVPDNMLMVATVEYVQDHSKQALESATQNLLDRMGVINANTRP
jgi:hypothetical protein